jgi:hypothetical protein
MAVMTASLMLPAPCRYALFTLVLSPVLFAPPSAHSEALLPPLEATSPTASGLEILAPRPESHLLDAGRVFAFEKDTYQSLSKRLVDAKNNQGVNIYVAVYSFLINETIDDRAARLRNKWLSDQYGVVIVYDTSTGELTLAATRDYRNFLPHVDLMNLFADVADSARAYSEAPERIATATNTMIAELPRRLQNTPANQPLIDQRMIVFGAGLLGALLVLAALGILLFHAQGRAESNSSRFYYFPVVHTPPRFCAPNGGGAMAELHFSTGAPVHPSLPSDNGSPNNE